MLPKKMHRVAQTLTPIDIFEVKAVFETLALDLTNVAKRGQVLLHPLGRKMRVEGKSCRSQP